MKDLFVNLIRIIWRVFEILLIERSAPEEQGFAVFVSLILLGMTLVFIAVMFIKTLVGIYNCIRNIVVSKRRKKRMARRMACRDDKGGRSFADDCRILSGCRL